MAYDDWLKAISFFAPLTHPDCTPRNFNSGTPDFLELKKKWALLLYVGKLGPRANRNQWPWIQVALLQIVRYKTCGIQINKVLDNRTTAKGWAVLP